MSSDAFQQKADERDTRRAAQAIIDKANKEKINRLEVLGMTALAVKTILEQKRDSVESDAKKEQYNGRIEKFDTIKNMALESLTKLDSVSLDLINNSIKELEEIRTLYVKPMEGGKNTKTKHKHSNGRSYVVHKGDRGGRFIMKGGKKFYI